MQRAFTVPIEDTVSRAGGSAARCAGRVALKGSFTDKDRDVVRQGVKTRTTERQATGGAAKVVRSERLPDSVDSSNVR
ncbi:hypothetical protein ABIE85_005330 [Bradyrhizobium diazoefficiens]|jgi:hypothetical protein|uniref:hypothetical protein n=1 Tax=Bradyrhizobium diazoefficiens TaxID=1355477 RepID=UPI00272A3E33|nr:hypothetical protein [Bradyrhizobium diazoefficiens]WLA55923.1 hypothetical protein QIH81_36250 [Bradyrhizobium diazoefficiens]